MLMIHFNDLERNEFFSCLNLKKHCYTHNLTMCKFITRLPDSLWIHSTNTVFCPGLKKGTVLLKGQGHFCVRNYILRALLRTKLHFGGTFVRGPSHKRK